MTSHQSIEWPASWRSVPLWSLFERVKDVGHPNEEMLSVYRDHGVVRKGSRDDNYNKAAENRDIYQLVDEGWLIVNRMKAWQGSVGISPYRGIVSGHYICFRPWHEEEPRFLNWLLRSAVYTMEYFRLSRGVRPSQLEIDNDWLRVLPVHLPSRPMQGEIADFLDRETGRIDALVAKKIRMVGLLEERIACVIRQRVANSTLADSMAAETATTIKKALIKLDRPSASDGEMVTAFRDGQVTARSLRRADGYTQSWTENARLQGVRKDDVVVHGLDGFAGAIGAAEVDGVCSPIYHVCAPTGGGDAQYLGRMLHILAVDGYLGLFASSTRERAFDFRNWDLFGRIPIPNVHPSEQAEVGDSIRKIAPLKLAVERSTELARERQNALITAAVTGQMEIPGVSR